MSLGSYGTNCYIVQVDGAADCVIADPGAEPERILAALTSLGADCRAILITHAHIDHIGAVPAIAGATGAPVYATADDAAILETASTDVPPGFPPRSAHPVDHLLADGDHLELAGIGIDVIATPGHAAGAVTLRCTGPDGDQVLLVGDVLFAGSVGRTDLPGGDWPTLEASIARLLAVCDADIPVLPGHGPATTLRHERATNPFLTGLAADD